MLTLSPEIRLPLVFVPAGEVIGSAVMAQSADCRANAVVSAATTKAIEAERRLMACMSGEPNATFFRHHLTSEEPVIYQHCRNRLQVEEGSVAR